MYLILFLTLYKSLSQSCTVNQYLANITNTQSILPMNQVIQWVTQQFMLNGIADPYNPIQDFLVYPKIINYQIAQIDSVTYSITFNQTLVMEFSELYNQQQILGQTIGQESLLQVTLQWQNSIWNQFGNLINTPPTQYLVGLAEYSSTFSNVSTLINDNLPGILQAFYQSTTLPFFARSNTTLYTYTNIQGDKQEILYNITYTSLEYQSGTLLERVLYIIDFNQNNCTALDYQGSTQLLQLEVYSSALINSTFKYAFQKGYFNAVLNSKWKSAEFQFIIASLQNVLTGLQGNYLISQSVNGSCTAQSGSINYHNTSMYQANFSYTCDLNSPNQKSSVLASVTFELSTWLSLEFENNYIYLMSTRPSLSNIKFISGTSSLQREQLAELYLKSVVNRQFNNTQVFGSLIPTLTRVNPQYTLTTDYILIQDDIQA